MRESVTFIHAADLHLDAPFFGISADDERVGSELAEATYEAWRKVVDLAIERRVDFVVLAGDVYNAADTTLRAQFRLREQARRLAEAQIGLLIAHGNHDPLSGWSAGLELPGNVRVFSGDTVERVPAVLEGDFVVGVYGRSFRTAAEREDFTGGYARDPRDSVAIGVLHANVGNNPDYDPYAPCTLDALRSIPMDYWALGHIHKHEVLARDPWVVYAGSAQGLNPKEIGAHGACVVTISRTGAVEMEHVELAPVVWAQLEVDVSGAEGLEAVEAAVAAALEAESNKADRPLVARVRLAGRAGAHADLVRPGVMPHLLASLREEFVSRHRWVWLDRLEDATASELDLASLAADPTFPGEIVRLVDELLSDPGATTALVESAAVPVQEKLAAYEPGIDAATPLQLARDRVLELLLAEGEGR